MSVRKKTIRVTLNPELKSMPLPGGLAVDSVLDVITPETSVEVLFNRFTRRRLKCGDFVEAKRSAPKKPKREPAPPAPTKESEEG